MSPTTKWCTKEVGNKKDHLFHSPDSGFGEEPQCSDRTPVLYVEGIKDSLLHHQLKGPCTAKAKKDPSLLEKLQNHHHSRQY